MKERGILFSDAMVRAILAGKKTQTRRAMRTNHVGYHSFAMWDGAVGRRAMMRCLNDPGIATGSRELRSVFCDNNPYGVPGDRLWVRETFAAEVPGCEHQGGYSYRADHRDPRGDGPANPMTWTPAIHMPREAARITLEVVDVRVERLHRIDDEEAAREGIRGWSKDGALWKYAPADAEGDGPCWPWVDCPRSAREAFKRLWCEINGESSWAENPWVWRIEFRKAGGAR